MSADMSVARTYAWRTWDAYGGHLLDQRFPSPDLAGSWRRDQFGPDHHGLTLVALDSRERVRFLTASELCDAHYAWQRPDLDNETAAGGMDPRTAA